MPHKTDDVSDLLVTCTVARLNGEDFPTIWINILKMHPLVMGDPVQHTDRIGPYLAVPLVTGQRLKFGSLGFSVG
jgi:hypothetical protein